MIKIRLDQTIPVFTMKGFDIIPTETLSDTNLLKEAEQECAWLYTTSRSFLPKTSIQNPGIVVFEEDAWNDYANWFRNGILARAKKFTDKIASLDENVIYLVKANGVHEQIN